MIGASFAAEAARNVQSFKATVGASLGPVNTRLGWTSVHSQTRSATTKAIIGPTAFGQNQHLTGFGSNVDPQPGAGAAYNWSYMDSTYGFPYASSGYFSSSPERMLTICGCPPHMRVPKVAGQWDPQGVISGAQLTSLSEYVPPNSSWFAEYAALVAAFAVRYPHVKYFQVWNEMKGFYVTNQYAGSNAVPTGSGLPAGMTALSNRWWYEGYTTMFNAIWDAVKAPAVTAARIAAGGSEAFIVGPYNVLNAYSWDSSGDWANDAAPYNFSGPWGYTDNKSLATLIYFIANCHGTDALCVDWRNLTKDSGAGGYYTVPGIVGQPYIEPTGTPDFGNQWLSNPEGGVNQRFWLEGQVLGPWNQGQRLLDFDTWLRTLGASSIAYQRPVADARTLPIVYAEWYAYAGNQFHGFDPRTGKWYLEPIATHASEVAAFAWQYSYSLRAKAYYVMAWKPEGTVQSNVYDPGDSNPLALYNPIDAPLSLEPTELHPMMVSLQTTFPVGMEMFAMNIAAPEVIGLATPTKIMLISRKDSMAYVVIDDPGRALDRVIVPIPLHGVLFLDR